MASTFDTEKNSKQEWGPKRDKILRDLEAQKLRERIPRPWFHEDLLKQPAPEKTPAERGGKRVPKNVQAQVNQDVLRLQEIRQAKIRSQGGEGTAQDRAVEDSRAKAQAKLRGEKVQAVADANEKVRSSQTNTVQETTRPANTPATPDTTIEADNINKQAKAAEVAGKNSPRTPVLETVRGAAKSTVDAVKTTTGKASAAFSEKFPTTSKVFGLAKGAPGLLKGLIFNAGTATMVGAELIDKFALEDPGERTQDTQNTQAQLIQGHLGDLGPSQIAIANRADASSGWLGRLRRGSANTSFWDAASGFAAGAAPRGSIAGGVREATTSSKEDKNQKDLEAAQTEIGAYIYDHSGGDRAAANATIQAFQRLTKRAAQPDMVERLGNPDLNEEQRIAAYRELATTLQGENVDTEGLTQIMQGLGVHPKFLQFIGGHPIPTTDTEIGGAGPKVGEPGITENPTDFVQGSDIPGVNSPIRTNAEDPNSFSNFEQNYLTKPAFNMDENGNLIPEQGAANRPDSPEARAADQRARQQLYNETPELTGTGRNQYNEGNAYQKSLENLVSLNNDGSLKVMNTRGFEAAKGWANQLDKANSVRGGSAQIEVMARQANMNSSFAGGSAARLMSLPLNDRMAAIAQEKIDGRIRVEQKLRMPGSQRRIERMADPHGTLREAAKKGYRGARDAMSTARMRARDDLRESYMSEFVPDYGEQIEGTNLDEFGAGQSTTNREITENKQEDLDGIIQNFAGDDAVLADMIKNNLISSGVWDQAGMLDRRQTQESVFSAYAVNSFLQTFQKGTKIHTGTGKYQNLETMFGPEGEYSMRTTEGMDVIRNNNRGSLVANLISAATGGKFGNTDIDTIIVVGPGGKSLPLRDFIKDPKLVDMFGPTAREAMNTKE